jgi:CBS domain containing-hemolysin-like protein
MGEYWTGLVWLVVLLALNAFFVGAEFAVISARRSQIEPKAEAGSRPATTALWAMEHATLMLATCQLGITVCSLVILNVAEPSIHHLIELPFGETGLSERTVTLISFAVALGVVTFLHVVFGEMVPKNIAFSIPDRAVLILAVPLVFVSRVVRPVIWLLNEVANNSLRLVGVEPKDEANSTYTLDEIATIVEQSTEEGLLEDESGTVTATFEFSGKYVSDVEVPIGSLVILPPETTPADVQEAVVRHGFSRYIVADRGGTPIGYVHVKDVMDLAGTSAFREPIPFENLRPLDRVDRAVEIEDALERLRRMGDHIAIVIDERGDIAGALFLEDIIEVLVGEVYDSTQRVRPIRPRVALAT